MSTPAIRAYLSAPDARPFFDALFAAVGLTEIQSPLDAERRTDPFALMQQKAEQDLALKIASWGGWSLRATPPARTVPAGERPQARTDGDGRDG
jgi:hypothetical protein